MREEACTVLVPGFWRLSWLCSLSGMLLTWTLAAAQAPPLTINQEDGQLVLQWPASATNFLPESTGALGTNACWFGLTNTPHLTARGWEVTNSPGTDAQFYRLLERFDFYGRPIGMLRLFGQARWGDVSPGRVDDDTIYHAPGVVVDCSDSTNRVYVADSGNNRILGFRSPSDAHAELFFGQPDACSGAPNGDGNLGYYGPTTSSNLCLTAYPAGPNVAEQWMRVNFDVDAGGNLYVPDFYNNRVLLYRAPFSADKSDGKGDTIADFVWGQTNFLKNSINLERGVNQPNASSLHLSYGGFDHVSARGVSVDAGTNLWVADTFNYRVLRFPPGSAAANLVLGQAGFTNVEPACQLASAPTNAPLNRMCAPTLARVNPETGELWVIDEFPGGFPARILIFTPPFSNGASATRQLVPRQLLEGDYAGGYRFTHATGLIFNRFKTDDLVDPGVSTNRYQDGVCWLQANEKRVLLLDAEGNILLAINAPDTVHYGGNYSAYDVCGTTAFTPYNLIWPGGMIGMDSSNNLYIADEAQSRVARFALPYRYSTNGVNRCLPPANGGFCDHSVVDGVHNINQQNHVSASGFHQDNFGLGVFGNQLFVRDFQRYLVWTNYLEKTNGAPADIFVGQPSGATISLRNNLTGRATHTIDDHDRLWTTGEHGRIFLYQLPFTNNSAPLRTLLPLYWADAPNTEVDYRCEQPLAFDPLNHKLWVYDTPRHRLLRVANPDDWADKLYVDAVVGQANKTDGQINRGQPAPSDDSFGDVDDVKFDQHGNLVVVDNTYECHPNARVIAFLAADLASINTMFPDLHAKHVWCVESFTQTAICRIHDPLYGDTPFSPVSVAFNSRNEMVIGNDGYHRDAQKRLVRQLYLYRTPYAQTLPDAVIELPMGSPGEIAFDPQDNLIVQDHTWNRVWVLNYDRDPAWLRPWPPAP